MKMRKANPRPRVLAFLIHLRPSMPPHVKILYQDSHVMVFDKPAGVLVVPDHKGKSQTLTDLVNQENPVTEQGRLYPCHRLDRDTSGVIIYARGRSAQEHLMEQFRNGLVEKRYWAFVDGKVRAKAGEIKSRISDFHEQKYQRGPNPRERMQGKIIKRPTGKLAITRYKVLAVKHRFSVVEVNPVTGRTNQIRIHFKELGHPLLGERLYALGRDANVPFRRVALHAMRVSFKHPQTGMRITVESELAKDMENFLSRY